MLITVGSERSRECCVNWYNPMGYSAPSDGLIIHYYTVAVSIYNKLKT